MTLLIKSMSGMLFRQKLTSKGIHPLKKRGSLFCNQFKFFIGLVWNFLNILFIGPTKRKSNNQNIIGPTYSTFWGGESVDKTVGPDRDLNPGPLAPKARIIPLDHRAIRSPHFFSFWPRRLWIKTYNNKIDQSITADAYTKRKELYRAELCW